MLASAYLDPWRASKLLEKLKERGCSPDELDITVLGRYYLAVAHNRIVPDTTFIEEAGAGLSTHSGTAIIKALVEYVERKAFLEGNLDGNPACDSERSDGFAGFPKILRTKSQANRCARDNAFLEATERYVWSYWWDNPEVGAEIREFKIQKRHSVLIEEIQKNTPLDSIQTVVPKVDNGPRTTILIAGLKGGGYISGGAASKGNSDSFERPLSEMLRHSIGLHRLQNKDSKSFYEERLKYFGLGLGDRLVKERLSMRSGNGIVLPPLSIDQQISHSVSEHVAVHRCLFKGQPHFVGGRLERLCI